MSGRDKAIFDNCFSGIQRPTLIRDNDYSNDEIAVAIYRVAGMTTHNSTNKDSLCMAILWLFETYLLEERKDESEN